MSHYEAFIALGADQNDFWSISLEDIIKVQSLIRGFMARRQLRKLQLAYEISARMYFKREESMEIVKKDPRFFSRSFIL